MNRMYKGIKGRPVTPRKTAWKEAAVERLNHAKRRRVDFQCDETNVVVPVVAGCVDPSGPAGPSNEKAPQRKHFRVVAFQSNADPEDVSESETQSDALYYLIHKNQLSELLSKLLCPVCKIQALSLKMKASYGFAGRMDTECTACQHVVASVYTSPRMQGEGSTRPPFEVNNRLVETFMQMGQGHAAMEKFSMHLDVPIMSRVSFNAHLGLLEKKVEQLKTEVLEWSRKIVRQAHHDADPTLDPNAPLDITVSYDGAYQRRGFVSNYAIGSVIDVLTGLVVDFEVMSKFCGECKRKESEYGNTKTFSVWYEKHKADKKCECDHVGSSGAMEVKIAETLWSRSLAVCNMRYTGLLSDGDCSTYPTLLALDPYPGIEIQKEECVNHVQKRMGEGLKNIRIACSKVGITLGGTRAGALTDVAIKKLQTFYRNAIVENTPHVHIMKSRVMAPLLHYSSTDKEATHHLCKPGPDSWCWYSAAIAKGLKPDQHSAHPPLINSTVIEKIKPLYERLSQESLLSRCVRGGTQNANENFHQVVWNKAPKERFQSKQRLEMVVTYAVSEFNMGNESSLRLRKLIDQVEMSSVALKVSKQRDYQRLRQAQNVRKAIVTRAKKREERAKQSQQAQREKRKSSRAKANSSGNAAKTDSCPKATNTRSRKKAPQKTNSKPSKTQAASQKVTAKKTKPVREYQKGGF